MKYLVGSSAAQSARATTLLQDQLTARFERVLQAEIARAMGEMIAQYEVTRATPALPVEHEARMAEIWAQMANMSIRAFGGRILEYGVKHCNPYTVDNGKTWSLADNGGYTFETKSFAELFARLSLEYISSEMIRARITMVSETLRNQIVNVIGAGQAAGSTLPEISKQLRTLSRSIPRFRADMIARTEVHGAANYGADEAAKATGLTLRKEWVAAGDGRTRDEHADMDGTVVDMDQDFNFGSYRLMYPGDRSGPPRGVINCRCQIAHVVDDEFDVDQGQGVISPAMIAKQSAARLRNVGKASGNEHFEVISKDGAILQSGTSGDARKVVFTKEQVAAMSNAGDEIALHHNHPAPITSFSPADIWAFRRLPGLSEMHAHAELATFRISRTSKTSKLTQAIISRAERDAKAALARAYNKGANINELLMLEPHAMTLILERRGYVKYTSELPDNVRRTAGIIYDNL